MNQKLFTDVDSYFSQLFCLDIDLFSQIQKNCQNEGLPEISVSACQGKFLQMLVMISKAQRVLEIGTLGGYSGVWLSLSLPETGKLVTIESDEKHAQVAQKNFELAKVANKVEIICDDAKNALKRMTENNCLPFDMVFIDADKQSYPQYLNYALQLSHSGTIIIGDNAVREGEIIDKNSSCDRVIGMRKFLEALAADERLHNTVIQTVGNKGYDGFSISTVK